jgi:hypothetical protein
MKLLDSAALGRMAGSTPDEAVGVSFPPQPLGAGSLPQVQSIWFTTGSTAWEQVVF